MLERRTKLSVGWSPKDRIAVVGGHGSVSMLLDRSYLLQTVLAATHIMSWQYSHHNRSFVVAPLFISLPLVSAALNDLTSLFAASSTLDKDKSLMSSAPAPARSSMSSVVGLTAGLAGAAKQQRSEHAGQHTANNGRWSHPHWASPTHLSSVDILSLFSCTFLDSARSFARLLISQHLSQWPSFLVQWWHIFTFVGTKSDHCHKFTSLQSTSLNDNGCRCPSHHLIIIICHLLEAQWKNLLSLWSLFEQI